jgi:enoyl-CoA hydratase/carnithine racemase
MSEHLLVSTADRICTLTLNRPEVLNALNYTVFKELQAAVERLAGGTVDVGCVILRGNGKAFSSGHDLKDISAGSEGAHSEFEATVLESLAIGLVDRVVPCGELQGDTLTYAQSVVENSQHSHRVSKQILESTDGMRIHDGLDYEYTNSPGACSDMERRLAAFQDKSKVAV